MPRLSPKKDRKNRRDDPSPSPKENAQKRSRNDGCNNVGGDSNNGSLGTGSGLADFFCDFAPHQSESKDEPVGFLTKLSRLPATTNPFDLSNRIEQSIGVTYIDRGLRYGQWRNEAKERLENYLKLRLYPHSNEESNRQSGDSTLCSSESSDDDHDDVALEPESQSRLETQEPIVEKHSGRKKKRNRRSGIPFVEDCLHDLTKLEYLDLHARTLSLNLSRINKIWRLRDTKRIGYLGKSSIRKAVFESCSATSRSQRSQQFLKQLVLEDKEEDGPVAEMYQQVLHFEVEQLRFTQGGGHGGGVSNPSDLLLSSGNRLRQQRIKVFFYNSYATSISEWLDKQKDRFKKKRKHDKSTSTTDTTAAFDVVMSLSNIPAVSIFPYAVDPRNWREKQELTDYCLCIGDDSVAISRKVKERETFKAEKAIRFDSKEMEIRLMTVVRHTTISRTRKAVEDNIDATSELILSRRMLSERFLSSSSSEKDASEAIVGKVELQIHSEELVSPLQKSWEAFKKNHVPDSNKNEKNKYDPSTHRNQRGVATDGHFVTTSDEKQHGQKSNVARRDDDKPFDVEPMIVEGVSQRRLDSRKMMYKYVKLGDIPEIVKQSIDAGRGWNFKVNLYASIVAVTPPRITKRGDWMVAATLVDKSCLTPMTINIFSKKQEHLPKLIMMGDVLRIHRAALEKYYEKIQLQGLRITQYVVIRKLGGNWRIIPTATKYFTFNRSDEERSQALWRWANSHAQKNPSMKPEHCFTLEQLRHLQNNDDKTSFETKDITVMVVQKLRYKSLAAHPHGLLRVWDGTGNSPSDPLFMQRDILNPPPEERLEAAYPRAIERVIRASQQLQASTGTMKVPISLCGRVANVVVWEKSHWDLIHEHIPVGTFLRLRNVHTPKRWESDHFRSIFMHDKSWMTALPTNNYEVRSLMYQHNERVRKGHSNNNSCNAYNPEFGGRPDRLPHLPSYRFVGSGLSRFRKEEKAAVYTGAVNVLSFDASARRLSDDDDDDDDKCAANWVTIADRSGSFQVLITKKARQELQNLRPDAPHVEVLDWNRRYLVTIRTIVVNHDGTKHFVLTNLAPID